MGDPTKNSPQTNYMPEEEFVMRREAAKRRGDIWMHTSGDLLVPFDSDFDKFAANVAYAIRGLVVYRSDGGVFARGLVRASGHLKMYHDAQMAVTPPTNGTKIRLVAIFYRRKDPRANMRWMMNIKFVMPDWVDEEPEAIIASREATDAGWAKAMRVVLDCAALAEKDFTGDQADEIHKMVALAERLGYPRNWDLWYYDRNAVNLYVDFHTNEETRRQMTRGTNGLTPFDGNSGYGEWRIFPFQFMAKTWGTLDHDHCNRNIRESLRSAEEYVHDTLQDVIRKLKLAGGVQSFFQGYNIEGGQLNSPLQKNFISHLINLLKDPDSLYSAFIGPADGS